MSFLKKSVAVTAIAFTFAGLGAGASYANSVNNNTGNCSSDDSGWGGDACLYYHTGFTGARVADPNTTSNYDDLPYTFHSWYGGSDGAGQWIRNNAASVSNWDLSGTLNIWYSPGYGLPVQHFAPNSGGDLNSQLKNNEASQSWNF